MAILAMRMKSEIGQWCESAFICLDQLFKRIFFIQQTLAEEVKRGEDKHSINCFGKHIIELEAINVIVNTKQKSAMMVLKTTFVLELCAKASE